MHAILSADVRCVIQPSDKTIRRQPASAGKPSIFIFKLLTRRRSLMRYRVDRNSESCSLIFLGSLYENFAIVIRFDNSFG